MIRVRIELHKEIKNNKYKYYCDVLGNKTRLLLL